MFQADIGIYETGTVHLTKMPTQSTSSNSFHDIEDVLTSSSSLSPSPQILQSTTVLPIQTLNNNDTYIINDTHNMQDNLKKCTHI